MNARRKRVVFFLPSLGGGGAEMHLLRVLNRGKWEQLEPCLILARRGGAYEAALDARIKCLHLLPPAIRSSTLSLMLSCWPLKRALRALRPSVVCSLLNHATVVMDFALGRHRPPSFLVGLQNNVGRDLNNRSMSARWFNSRVGRAFRRADHFVALSHGVADDFRRNFPRLKKDISVIYNAGFDDRILSLAQEPLSGIEPPASAPLIVSCGRLTAQKNFPLLLQAFAQARAKMPLTLWILGDGELRPSLERLTAKLGLSGSVRFLGFQTNPFKYLARANAFVLSSEWEGFGNVIVEAMALGVPVISTDCPFGPGEIIRSGENGLLVPMGAAGSLSDAMLAVCTDQKLAAKLSAAGRRRAEDFRAERIAENYERLIEQLATSAPPVPATAVSSRAQPVLA